MKDQTNTPLFNSSDNGQVSCEKHIPEWGFSLLDTWEPIQEYSFQFQGETIHFECEICRSNERKELEKMFAVGSVPS